MIRFVLLFLLLPFFVAAQIPKAKPNTYVNDYTGWLSEVQVQVLNEQILHLEKTTSVQLAVLLINRLPVKMEIEEYAREVGNQWKVGKNFRGLVYVAAVDDRRHRLEVGHNLEGDIPDITALAILDSAKPYLIQQEYYEAVHHLVDAIQ
ncbi:MAG TPA: TPM domain-containing protein, partial [Flavisolibacter sp.]|nr:TPM domain-containing protein [Flavisolibacter sp.]